MPPYFSLSQSLVAMNDKRDKLDVSRIARLRAIDALLSSATGLRGGYTVSQIVEQLSRHIPDVDRFKVMRDLETIKRLLGDEIVVVDRVKMTDESGRELRMNAYRYSSPHVALFRNYTVELDDRERDLLLWALSHVEGLKGVGALRESLARVLRLDSAESLSGVITYTTNPLEGNALKTRFSRLLECIKERVPATLAMRGRRPGEANENRHVQPFYLREYNRRWYMFGYDFDKRRIMHFALDRMLRMWKLEPGGKYGYDYDNMPVPPVEELLADVVGVSMPEGGKTRRIGFFVAARQADFIKTKPIHRSQRVVDGMPEEVTPEMARRLGDGVFFEIECIDNYELRREMMSCGADLTVLYPNDLREEIRETLRQMSALYDEV